MTARQDTTIDAIIERFVARHPTALDDIAERALLDQLSSALRDRFEVLDLDLDDPAVRRAALVAVDLVLHTLEHAQATCDLSRWMHSIVARATAAYISIERHHQELGQ